MGKRKLQKLMPLLLTLATATGIASPALAAAKIVNINKPVDAAKAPGSQNKRYNNIVITNMIDGIRNAPGKKRTVYLSWRAQKKGIVITESGNGPINSSLLKNGGNLTVNGRLQGSLKAAGSGTAAGINNIDVLAAPDIGNIAVNFAGGTAYGIENHHQDDRDFGRIVLKSPYFAALQAEKIGAIAVTGSKAFGIYNENAFLTGKSIQSIAATGKDLAIGVNDFSQTGAPASLKIEQIGTIAASASGETACAAGIKGNPATSIKATRISSITASAKGEAARAYGIFSSNYFSLPPDDGDDGGYSAGGAAQVSDSDFTFGQIGNIAAVATGKKAKAYGIFSDDAAIAIDKATIDAKAFGAGAKAYGVFADDAPISLKSARITAPLAKNSWALFSKNHGQITIGDGSAPVQITGNIKAFPTGSINIVLPSAADFYRGQVQGRGNITFDLGNGGQIEPFFAPGQTDENLNAAINGRGVIDLSWDDRTRVMPRHLSIKELNGTQILRINTDLKNNRGDNFVIGSSSHAKKVYVQVADDPFFHHGHITQKSIYGYCKIIISSPRSMRFLPLQSAIGPYLVVPKLEQVNPQSGSWDIVSLLGAGKPKPSENTKAAAREKEDIGNTLFFLNQSLSQRLGDLHFDAGKNHFYLRREQVGVEHAACKFDDDIAQLGYDKGWKKERGTLYYGLAIDKLTGTSDFGAGHAKTTGGDIALYRTYAGKDGHYWDFILRRAHLKTSYCVTDRSNTFSTAAIRTDAVSASAEYGRRFNFGQNDYCEPQIQLTFSHIDSGKYRTSTGYDVTSGAYNRSLARIGLACGHADKKASYYARLDFFHNFSHCASVKFSDFTFDYQTAKNWEKATLGANFKLSPSCRSYLELSRYFGDIKSTKTSWNFGLRWMF